VLVGAAALFLVAWPGFYPRDVTVSGNRRVSSGQIRQSAQVAQRVSIWLQDTKGMSARIRAIPYVAKAAIYRLPPASLRIAIVERVPYAVLDDGGQSVVVDRDLRVLSAVQGGEQLPVMQLRASVGLEPGTFVTDGEAISLRNAYAKLGEAGLAPARVAFDRYGDLVVTMPDELRLLLGAPERLDEKVRLVKAIVAQVLRGQRRVAAIDVRAPAAPVVVYR
jgi:cell division protein FtsQ